MNRRIHILVRFVVDGFGDAQLKLLRSQCGRGVRVDQLSKVKLKLLEVVEKEMMMTMRKKRILTWKRTKFGF